VSKLRFFATASRQLIAITGLLPRIDIELYNPIAGALDDDLVLVPDVAFDDPVLQLRTLDNQLHDMLSVREHDDYLVLGIDAGLDLVDDLFIS
jgi:hypothetical protein